MKDKTLARNAKANYTNAARMYSRFFCRDYELAKYWKQIMRHWLKVYSSAVERGGAVISQAWTDDSSNIPVGFTDDGEVNLSPVKY